MKHSFNKILHLGMQNAVRGAFQRLSLSNKYASLLLGSLLFSITLLAQYDSTRRLQPANMYGLDNNVGKYKHALIIPTETPKLALGDSGAIAYKGGTIWAYDGVLWKEIHAGEPFPGGGGEENGLHYCHSSLNYNETRILYYNCEGQAMDSMDLVFTTLYVEWPLVMSDTLGNSNTKLFSIRGSVTDSNAIYRVEAPADSSYLDFITKNADTFRVRVVGSGGSGTSGSGGISNITGLISQGTNVTITGSGTVASPYVINATGSGGGGVVLSKEVHTTGNTRTLLNATNWLVINPAAELTALSITMPPAPTDGQTIDISFGGTITASGAPVVSDFNIVPNTGQGLIGSGSIGVVETEDHLVFRFDATTSKWFKQ